MQKAMTMSAPAEPAMMTGYAFESPAENGNPCRASWRYLPSDAWETVVHAATGAELYLGFRLIDGTRHNVWICPDGFLRAQVALGS